jgi:hypothetical protein
MWSSVSTQYIYPNVNERIMQKNNSVSKESIEIELISVLISKIFPSSCECMLKKCRFVGSPMERAVKSYLAISGLHRLTNQNPDQIGMPEFKIDTPGFESLQSFCYPIGGDF